MRLESCTHWIACNLEYSVFSCAVAERERSCVRGWAGEASHLYRAIQEPVTLGWLDARQRASYRQSIPVFRFYLLWYVVHFIVRWAPACRGIGYASEILLCPPLVGHGSLLTQGQCIEILSEVYYLTILTYKIIMNVLSHLRIQLWRISAPYVRAQSRPTGTNLPIWEVYASLAMAFLQVRALSPIINRYLWTETRRGAHWCRMYIFPRSNSWPRAVSSHVTPSLRGVWKGTQHSNEFWLYEKFFNLYFSWEIHRSLPTPDR